MNKNLFEDSDDNIDEESFEIKTNESYAKTYNALRKKELLQKFKENSLNDSESESSDSTSSEEDEILDPTFDKEFLKTLASLKSKDPLIYDKNTTFFKKAESDNDSAEDGVRSKMHKVKKSKPVTLKDYERRIIIEKGGQFVDDSDGSNNEELIVQRAKSPTLVEEERRLKAEFKKVMSQENDSSDEEFGGIFKKREKTKIEIEKEEEDYLNWLAGKKEVINAEDKEKLEPLKTYWSNDQLPPSEKFLRDYVLNKGYTEATNYGEIPTYEEVIGGQAHLSEDEKDLDKQAEFEHKYNFRFEEPDQEFIKRYPRTINTSLRLTEDKRKKKRQEIKERKLQEKQQKMKELEMVKEMKHREIQEKIAKLKMVTGNDELGFKDDDFEEDFDPDAHDRRMKEVFNDDYYQIDEGEDKPECPSDIEELKVEDWDNYDPQQDEYLDDYDADEPHCEDEDFNMDCDYDPSKAKEKLQKELLENTRKRRKGRKGRRDRFMEAIKSEKPVFDPEDEKTYGEYIEEYYKLDCEDIIGDIPCRFKYVETTPNDFGLTIEEILLAKNKELNQWASLKKAIQIRPDNVEKKEQRLYKLKAKNEELKRKIFKSLYGEGSDNENEELEKDQKKKVISNENAETKAENINTNVVQTESKKSKKRRKRKAENALSDLMKTNVNYRENEQAVTSENLIKKSKNVESTMSCNSNSNKTAEPEVKELGKNKKKKNKNKMENASNEKTLILDNIAVRNNAAKNPFNKNSQKPIDADKKMYHTNSKSLKTNNSPNTKSINSKSNPFAKGCSKEIVGSLPPLRKNVSKRKTLNAKSNVKFKSKFKTKMPLSGHFKSEVDGNDISDERLKAYGINPRKFHKRQKYENKRNFK